MKKLLSIILILALLLSGCGVQPAAVNSSEPDEPDATLIIATDAPQVENSASEEQAKPIQSEVAPLTFRSTIDTTSFYNLDDPVLLRYFEDAVYREIVTELDSDEYFVENVSAVYISKEYLDELAYNSQANIYFGYTLAELEEVFQGTKYVFTLGEDGQTIVHEFESYDDTYDRVIRNVAIGTGVILLCVTVSVLTGGAAPAVSMIFAASAKTGAIFAASSGVISGVATGIITGTKTRDFDEAIKAGALAGSESFKWGAITGAVVGGAGEAIALHGATLNGLTMNEVAAIQKETKWPLAAIKNLHSTAEFEIYKNANLIPTQFPDGSWAFLREIDWTLTDSYGRTNAQRVAARLAPIDSTGRSYELHHIGQRADSPLAILSYAEHHSSGNFGILHYAEEGKDVADAVWAAQKADFWQAIMSLQVA